jgi:hypothetical protein
VQLLARCGFLLEQHRALTARVRRDHPEVGFGDYDATDGQHCGSTTQCTFSTGKRVQTEFCYRLAVTEAQVYQLDLPTRPAKQTDSRAQGFNGGSVEVDAIPPTVLRQIVEAAITQHIDRHELDITRTYEQAERDVLARLASGSAR